MVMVEGLTDRVAVVTGGGRGIGLAIVKALTANGARVATLDLTPPELDGVLGLEADVSDEAAVNDAITEVERQLGPVTILVLNAGILPLVPLEETSAELWERTLAINLTGGFYAARRTLPGMRKLGYGRVVVLGAAAGKSGGAKSAAYAASKAGLMTLAKSIAIEYAQYGVTANVVAPALIDTQLIGATREVAGRIPVGRMGTAEEVASLVAFLVSSEAGYITGEVVDINGGSLID
jgi:NAD(P)-dependent dehydrogenase (short-subunit alcohol dehydrogenase family)